MNNSKREATLKKVGTFKYEETTTKKRVIVLPLEKCLQCGKTDVTTFDCGYSSFNVCGVSCNGCGV